jgi:hypothetical protein
MLTRQTRGTHAEAWKAGREEACRNACTNVNVRACMKERGVKKSVRIELVKALRQARFILTAKIYSYRSGFITTNLHVHEMFVMNIIMTWFVTVYLGNHVSRLFVSSKRYQSVDYCGDSLPSLQSGLQMKKARSTINTLKNPDLCSNAATRTADTYGLCR